MEVFSSNGHKRMGEHDDIFLEFFLGSPFFEQLNVKKSLGSVDLKRYFPYSCRAF
jgi:hypothetical protein